MKTLERQFFRYCMKQTDYYLSNRDQIITRMSIRDIANDFCIKKKCSYKQLMYYINKWVSYGMYDYGVSLDLGWFNSVQRFPFHYFEIIPARTNTIKRIAKITNTHSAPLKSSL